MFLIILLLKRLWSENLLFFKFFYERALCREWQGLKVTGNGKAKNNDINYFVVIYNTVIS